MHAAQPLCRFVLTRRSILDTLFVNQAPRRPAYATTTDGSVTTLWCIDHRGALSEVAQIRWQGDASSRGCSTVVVNGQTMLVDNVLKRTKSFFGSDSRAFTAGTMHCKWKSGKGEIHAPDADIGLASVNTRMTMSSQAWTCCEAKPPPSRRRPHTNTSSTSSTSAAPVLAVFYPPQISLIKSEITIYPDGGAVIDHVILTAILICARKDEWRTVQSALTRAALEASLKAEIRGTLPPYIPTAADRHRVGSPRGLRRLQSTSVTRTRYASPPAPPPYTSVDDTSWRHR